MIAPGRQRISDEQPDSQPLEPRRALAVKVERRPADDACGVVCAQHRLADTPPRPPCAWEATRCTWGRPAHHSWSQFPKPPWAGRIATLRIHREPGEPAHRPRARPSRDRSEPRWHRTYGGSVPELAPADLPARSVDVSASGHIYPGISTSVFRWILRVYQMCCI